MRNTFRAAATRKYFFPEWDFFPTFGAYLI